MAYLLWGRTYTGHMYTGQGQGQSYMYNGRTYHPSSKGKELIALFKKVRKYIPNYETFVGCACFENNTMVCLYYDSLVYTKDRGRCLYIDRQCSSLRQRPDFVTYDVHVDKDIKSTVVIRHNETHIIIITKRAFETEAEALVQAQAKARDLLTRDSRGQRPLLLCVRSCCDLAPGPEGGIHEIIPQFHSLYYYHEEREGADRIVDREPDRNTCAIL